MSEQDARGGRDERQDPEPFDTSARSSRPTQEDRTKSPRRAMCAAVLTLEAIVLALTSPIMITLQGVSKAAALSTALGLAVACVVVAGLLRKEWGYWLGWALQVAAVALGFVVHMMWVLGVIFAVLWGAAYLLGRRIEDERAAAWEEWDRRQESSS